MFYFFVIAQVGHSVYSTAYSDLQTEHILFFLALQGLQNSGLKQPFCNSVSQ
jgi:hypothetical protein